MITAETRRKLIADGEAEITKLQESEVQLRTRIEVLEEHVAHQKSILHKSGIKE
jgi:cell division septum initiation protein DivIVA